MNILKKSFIIFIAKLVAAFLLFIPQIILAQKLGPKALGVFNLFLAAIGLFLLLGNLGIGEASIYLINKKKRDLNCLFFNLSIFGSLWGIFLAFLFYLLYFLFPFLFVGLKESYILLSFIIIPFWLLYSYLLPFFLVKFQALKWAFFWNLYLILLAVLTMILVIFFNLGVLGGILSMAISSIIVFLAVFFYILKSFSLKFCFNKSLFFEELKFGVSSYLGNVFNGTKINFMLTIFVINIFLGTAQVGYFSVAYNISAILLFIPFSLQQILYSKWSLLNQEEVDRKTPEFARKILIVGIISNLFLILISRQVVSLFYGKEFFPALFPFFLLIPGLILISFNSIFLNNFYSKGKPYIGSFILVITLVVNILLNIILIPPFNIEGAAISISVSYFLTALLVVYIFCKITGTSAQKVFLLKVADIKSIIKDFYNIFKK